MVQFGPSVSVWSPEDEQMAFVPCGIVYKRPLKTEVSSAHATITYFVTYRCYKPSELFASNNNGFLTANKIHYT